MAKLYVFGIGGTGSRVLRSLTMMLAAGVDTGGREVVPVIIDPDQANADLTRCVQLLQTYRGLQQQLSPGAGFFTTHVGKSLPAYTLPLTDTSNKTFEQFIGLGTLSRANEAFARMLFSDANLSASMEVGFKGNPNIGSVVLNQVATSPEFSAWANTFEQGDKVFIISSIFGGTGASGFPLLLKTLRQNKTMPNYALINQAEIGAISVLPYFQLERDADSAIDSSTFISKASAALAYYENNLDANALYLIGDTGGNVYANSEGGTTQRNAAHLIEFLAATAIIDFARTSYAGQRSYLELGLAGDTDTVDFHSFFAGGLQDWLFAPMVRLALAADSLVDDYDFVSSKNLNANDRLLGGTEVYRTAFVSALRDFLQRYREWTDELKNNKPALNLFNFGGSLDNLVNGVAAQRKVLFRTRPLNREAFRSALNEVQAAKGMEPADGLIDLYCKAAEKIRNAYIKL